VAGKAHATLKVSDNEDVASSAGSKDKSVVDQADTKLKEGLVFLKKFYDQRTRMSFAGTRNTVTDSLRLQNGSLDFISTQSIDQFARAKQAYNSN
jgi:hypothetical protein